jgi:hypothetical protein
MQSSRLIEKAKALADSAETWADLSNALFNPIYGLITTTYQTKEERSAFRSTDEYRFIRQLLNDTIDRTGLIEGATPKVYK